jgi:hypothetical protein
VGECGVDEETIANIKLKMPKDLKREKYGKERRIGNTPNVLSQSLGRETHE